ncbi:histidine phosphatase family protein [Hahella ganghwensis]|uniref:histidine phosphatase family protein n=1 Tax=Hahella ganghwensis TaxID=286420 RepID=UPI000379CE06|nr:histidine phosphatase family protein [Hahella ganghwensis]
MPFLRERLVKIVTRALRLVVSIFVAPILVALTAVPDTVLADPVMGESRDHSEALNGVVEGRYILLMRHAIAPGFGDPADFQINDCRTQRNLSQEGRDQAAAIGRFLKQHGIKSATVLSSQWCRCLETARLLDVGEVEELPALNSFFQQPDVRQDRIEAMQRWLIDYRGSSPTILVTHQVNITALTNYYPASGEVVVIQPPTKDRPLSVISTIK